MNNFRDTPHVGMVVEHRSPDGERGVISEMHTGVLGNPIQYYTIIHADGVKALWLPEQLLQTYYRQADD